jgi:hypothetical protein
MGPLPERRMGPALVFESIAVGLFGPLTFQDPYNKRRTGKAWGVIFVCMATYLVNVGKTKSYSTDFLPMALRRFMIVHRAHRMFHSDQGNQLMAASKLLVMWDWSKMDELCGQKGVTWRLVPTGGQHYNGQAERVIGMMKLCLAQTLEDKRCSIMELAIVLAEVAQAVQPPHCEDQAVRGPNQRRPHHPVAPAARKGIHQDSQGQVRTQPQSHQQAEVPGGDEEGVLEEVDGPSISGPSAGPEVEEAPLRRPGGRCGASEERDCGWSGVQGGRVMEAIPGEDRHVRSIQVECKNPREKLFSTPCTPFRKLQ